MRFKDGPDLRAQNNARLIDIVIQIKNGTSESKEALLFVNKKKQKNFDILVRGLRPMAGYDPN